MGVLLALAAAAAVGAAACSGSTSDAGASSDGGTPSGDDGATPVDHLPFDGGANGDAASVAPRCPATQPAAGAPCDPNPAPLACEYGGDTYGRCTTIADCARDSGATEFTWHVVPNSTCVPTNPAACPAQYGGLAEGSACPGASTMACDYDEGRCGCVCDGDGQAWTWKCRARVDFTATVSSVPAPNPLPVCSSHRPLLGTACAVEGEQCGYATYCAPAFSFGPSEQCRNGIWVVMPNNAACAASTCPP